MKPPLRLKAALAVTFAICIAIGVSLAQTPIKFGNSRLLFDTNFFTPFGASRTNAAFTSVSNAAVGGVVWTDVTATPIPSSNGTAVTISQVTIPNNALENTGDSVIYRAAGTMPTGVANTNNFVFVYGSTTIFDSGMQPSNTSYRAELMLTRSAAAQLLAQAAIWWGPAIASLPAQSFYTNTTVFIGETNIVDTVLKFQGTSRRAGSSTNLFNQLVWQPTGK